MDHDINNNVSHKNAGPHGLGDPKDTFLRKVELEVLIPKKMRDKSRAENCKIQVEEFNKCAKESGLKMVVTCQEVNVKMRECLTYWFKNPEFRQQCTDEYLKERAEYRSTGLSKKQRDLISSQNANVA